ncbi:MAG TPA: hypothetical protein VFQ61_26670 [Polyangiaceae bacterium]|nr:hypothetical protein [Polyangiaceae bacterium]
MTSSPDGGSIRDLRRKGRVRRHDFLRALCLALTCAAVLANVQPAGADLANATQRGPEDLSAQVQRSIEAIGRGAFDEGVSGLELLADRGVVHADVSLTRAYAYIERARSRSARPGDLGRAVAALEECEWLRPGTCQAGSSLSTLRSEIARRRARSGATEVAERPALARAVSQILPENTWAWLALCGSSLVSLGLAVYLFVKKRTAEITGSVAIGAGLLLMCVTAPIALMARHYRQTSRPAVVVAPEARLLEESGRPLPVRAKAADAVPEGALVYVRDQHDGRSEVEWGRISAWVDSSQLRVLQAPSDNAGR